MRTHPPRVDYDLNRMRGVEIFYVKCMATAFGLIMVGFLWLLIAGAKEAKHLSVSRTHNYKSKPRAELLDNTFTLNDNIPVTPVVDDRYKPQ